jgi:SAM-dependent methyltransferase
MNKNIVKKKINSADYHDYVIKDDVFIGDFEGMYRNSSGVPWHQDKTAYSIFTDIDLAILRNFYQEHRFNSILELGCGLWYIAARLKYEFPKCKVTGVDISPTAIKQAKKKFSGISFHVLDILDTQASRFQDKFDLVYVKDLLWYICHDMDNFINNLQEIIKKGAFIYILQSVPDLNKFYGQNLFPTCDSMITFFSKRFRPLYSSSTYEKNSKRFMGKYAIDKYVRFLGQKV